jgi:hypothetical protein
MGENNSMKPAIKAALTASLLIFVGCADTTASVDEDDEENLAVGSDELTLCEILNPILNPGKALFEQETFGGNGRVCRTCHDVGTGSISPASVKARFLANPNEPLFRGIDSDDGVSGASYQRLKTFATVLVTIDLPPYVRLADDPTATRVTLERGVPSTFDKHPVLEPVLMADTRAPSLALQALDAVHGHAQSTIEPTPQQLDKIAQFEAEQLYSSAALGGFAHGAPAPKLPPGYTASQQRGRKFVEDVPFNPAQTGMAGVCALCHSGPMLNTTKEIVANGIVLQGAGLRVSTAFVSELNDRNRPTRQYLFKIPAGVPVPPLPVPVDFQSVGADGVTTVAMTTSDPGLALISSSPIIHGDPSIAVGVFNLFKIPTLWNMRNTAPYFHDNSAATIEALVEHYNRFFTSPVFGLPPLSAQDRADLAAYLKLL